MQLIFNYRGNAMREILKKNEEQGKFSLDMAFMASLMVIAAIYGLWFLPALIKMLTKMVG